MRLRRISVARLPGITQPFDLEDLAHEVIVVVGPNGSGKSSLCRSVRAALWPEDGIPDPCDVVIVWEQEGGDLTAEIRRRVSWQRDGHECGPPSLPGRHLASCFTLGLRDLLRAEGASDRGLAERILVLMEGSNVRAVREHFKLKRNHGDREEQELKRAERELSRVKSEQARLADRADRLDDLEKRLEQARSAGQEIPLLEQAQNCARLVVACERAGALLNEFPPGMERLKGDENDLLAQLDADIEEATAQCDHQARVRAAAEKEMNACELTDGPIDVATLNSWLEKSRRLDGLERDLRIAREEEAEAREALIAHRAELAGELEPEGCTGVGGATLDAAARWVGEAQDLRGRRAVLEAELEALRPIDEALPEDPRGRVNTRLAMIVGLVLLVSGAVLALFATPWMGAVAGLGLGLLLMSLSGRIPRTQGEIATSQRQYVQQKLASLAQDEEVLDERRRSLCTELGVDPGISDLRLSDLAACLQRWRAAGERHARARGILGQREQTCAQKLLELQEYLRGRVDRDPRDAGEATGMLESLKDRGAAHARAEGERGRAQQTLAEAEQRLQQLRGRRDSLLRNSVPDAVDAEAAREALLGRQRRLDGWKEASRKRDQLEWDLKSARAGLSDREDLLTLSEAELSSCLIACKETSATVTELISEIESIKNQVREASRGDAYERSLADKEAAREALARRRHEDLHATTGRLLLEQVRQEYEHRSQPEVLKRARRFFARFTRNRYDLRVDPDVGMFRAFDAARGTGIGLSELSDGERVQLLLSARLAFATQSEGGLVLPLFLDEALTTADGDRFRAVCENLLELARDGRQIIYLTANASDVEHWRAISRELGRPEPQVVDLGEVRSMASSASREAELHVPESGEVPVPGDLSPEQYGLKLRVPLVDLHAPVEAVHLFHVLRPDLELLYRILDGPGVSDVRGWRLLESHGVAIPSITETERLRIDALIALTASFLEAWRVGRGRPVDRHALAASGAVSETFLDKLASLATELGGSSRRLVEAIEARQDERVHRFHQSKLEDLRFYLEGNGFLDPNHPLDSQRVKAMVLGTVNEALSLGSLTTEQATRKIRELEVLMERHA